MGCAGSKEPLSTKRAHPCKKKLHESDEVSVKAAVKSTSEVFDFAAFKEATQAVRPPAKNYAKRYEDEDRRKSAPEISKRKLSVAADDEPPLQRRSSAPDTIRRGSCSAINTVLKPTPLSGNEMTFNDSDYSYGPDAQVVPESLFSIGPYEITQYLGKGTWAIVHECYRSGTRERYAIKSYNKRTISDENLALSARKEAQIIQRLDKEKTANCCLLVDVYEDDDWYHMILDLVEGLELWEIINNCPCSENEAREYFRELCGALQSIHEQGICHRDIKPANIVVGSTVTLIDFGLAEYVAPEFRQSKVLTELCGTPDFMAPEIMFSKSAYNGFQADMWSCGVTLFTMLTGSPPWKGTIPARAKQQQHARIPTNRIDHLSPEVQHLIESLLQLNPTKRPTPEEVLQHPWLLVCPTGLKTELCPRSPSHGGYGVIDVVESVGTGDESDE
eukprot:TRINITY_DN20422_c0_g1_i1.p1 TRINITY_DN20422_c0_g1~~TRINITY_DN20422_c0_g1_i1.p1  ORF type:complete len:446 (+),score=96.49 TRINITY_DN20422_c0_g1_i1:63-1400(+)